VKFQMSGRTFDFDPDPNKLMGDEYLLIEEVLEDGFAERWAAGQVNGRDVLVMAYLAAKRGGETAPFSEFVKTVAPATFRQLPDDEPSEPVNREARRAKVKASSPAPA